MVGLDRRRPGAPVPARLDHIRIERSLDEEADVRQFLRLLLEHANELLADDLALALGLDHAGEPLQEALLSGHVDEPDPPVAKCLDHLLRLVLSQQAVIDEHAGELIPHCAVDEGRGRRGVDAPRQAADHASLADLGAHPLDLLVDDRSGRPSLLEAGDLTEEAVEDLRAVRRVDDLGVELDPVEALLGALERGDRRARAGGESDEAGRGLEDAVAVAHPALLLMRQPGQQTSAAVGEDQRRAAELPRIGALDAAAEDVDHRLHPVADAQHRDLELQQLTSQLRCALRVDGGRAARQDQRRRAPLADPLHGGVVGQQLGEHPALADPPGNQLGVLPPEVEDQYFLVGAVLSAFPLAAVVLTSRKSSVSRTQGAGIAALFGDRRRQARFAGAECRRRRRTAVSHPIRLPRWPRRRGRWSPCPRTDRAAAACPRSAATARPSPRRAGSRGCPHSRRWPSRCAGRRSG